MHSNLKWNNHLKEHLFFTYKNKPSNKYYSVSLHKFSFDPPKTRINELSPSKFYDTELKNKHFQSRLANRTHLVHFTEVNNKIKTWIDTCSHQSRHQEWIIHVHVITSTTSIMKKRNLFGQGIYPYSIHLLHVLTKPVHCASAGIFFGPSVCCNFVWLYHRLWGLFYDRWIYGIFNPSTN